MNEFEKLWSIRAELLVRVLIQNLTLIIASALFVFLGSKAISDMTKLWPMATVFGIATFTLVLQWCHSGVRTMQIKRYILLNESGQTDTWERWLPANRPMAFLGTRWVVSTKGVFLGLQLSFGMIAMVFASNVDLIWILGWAVTFLASAWFLFTNAKESL